MNHVIFAMPQGTSLGPEYYGIKPQLKEGDMEYDPDDLAINVSSIAAAGKEGSDKMTPVLVGGEDAGGRYCLWHRCVRASRHT